MRLTIVAFGTRGDVQPLLALGRGLKAAGHEIRVLASSTFREWIEQNGLEAAPASVDMHALMNSEGGQAWIEHSSSPLKQTRIIKSLLDVHGPAMIRDAWEASQDSGAVMSGFTSGLFVASIAEKLGIPHISALLQPVLLASRSGWTTASAPLPGRNSVINYWFSKWILEPFQWRLAGELTNQFRVKTLGLPRQTERDSLDARSSQLVVQGFSRHVVPPAADWPPNIHVAGYWFLDDESGWQPPRPLQEFLDAGEPPVYIGFGSMTGRDPERLTRVLVEAVQSSGHRAILQSGWAGLGGIELPSTIFRLESAPHSWLFPRVSATVHHGGAGTTAESLRAAVPPIIVPHMADQPFWGSRVAALGIGPRPIPRHRLTAGGLASAIQQATNDLTMRQRVQALGASIRAEDGIGVAVKLIEPFFTKNQG